MITNRELSIYSLEHSQFAVKEMFRKQKTNGEAEDSSAPATESYLSATRLSRVDPMAASFATGLRIRTGLNA